MLFAKGVTMAKEDSYDIDLEICSSLSGLGGCLKKIDLKMNKLRLLCKNSGNSEDEIKALMAGIELLENYQEDVQKRYCEWMIEFCLPDEIKALKAGIELLEKNQEDVKKWYCEWTMQFCLPGDFKNLEALNTEMERFRKKEENLNNRLNELLIITEGLEQPILNQMMCDHERMEEERDGFEEEQDDVKKVSNAVQMEIDCESLEGFKRGNDDVEWSLSNFKAKMFGFTHGMAEHEENYIRVLKGSNEMTIVCNPLNDAEVESLKARPRIDFSSIFSMVEPIVDDVRKRGDAAVKDYTARFDKVELDKIVEILTELPYPVLDASIREAFDVGYDNVYAFHFAQKSTEKGVENMEAVKCKRVARSISSVGLYVPGGTAVLPSTAMMLSVPVQIAGCKTIVLATPPSQDGSICKEVLYCAKRAGVTHILKAGGAQAISAMAWGTDSCPKVEKIFGIGNQYVTASKRILQNSEAVISIDIPTGPSEVLVIADRFSNPVHVAADLLSQAEHDPDSQVVLVISGDGVDLKAIEEEISKQCQSLPRGEVALKALSHIYTVFASDMVEAITFSNLFAPENLIINAGNQKAVSKPTR